MVSLINTVKNTDRMRQIATVLAKHGFGELLARTGLLSLLPGRKDEPRPTNSIAVRLREVAQELGPSFVKLGQIASTRGDLLPDDVVIELKKLQDDVPPMKPDEVAEVLAEAFGETHDQVFASFEAEPLASASIGQVHCAVLRTEDGREVDVVVKLQRPRIRATIERDIDLLYLLARLIERHVPESKIYSPAGLVAEFDRAIMAELDFTLEADNAERFARNFAGDPRVRFPHVYRHASTRKVLTMERFRGEKIYPFVERGQCGELVAQNALHIVARQIFEHGFFHADPHPGNIIMLGTADSPVVGLIDLGLVGRLSPDMRDAAVGLLVAAARQDPDAIADALLAIGRPRGRVDQRAFRAEVSQLSEKYLGRPIAEIELAALVRDLVQGAVKYDIEMPTEMMMVGKALMTVEGIGKEIHPDLDAVGELRPYLVKLLMQRYSPERVGKDLLRGLGQLTTVAQRFPSQVNDILDDLRSGQLQVKTSDPQLPEAADRVGRRVFAAISTAGITLSGAALLAAGRHETLGWTLLCLSGANVLLHLVRDWRR